MRQPARPMLALTLLTVAIAVFPGSGSAVQDPFAKYVPTTLAARFTAAAEAADTNADLIFTGAGAPSRARVEFLGKSRPLTSSNRGFCESAFQTLGFDKKLNEVLSDEWQFRENGLDYWLAVQKQVAEYFPKGPSLRRVGNESRLASNLIDWRRDSWVTNTPFTPLRSD